MGIALYEHNSKAYQAALSLLAQTGKAAVIHPTGTGKSFIGFKLCEDYPGSTVCWLSPSEYIFKTQLENLKNASGGCTLDNIRFFTYAKLMLMNQEELAQIKPDYIVLDEFHRCGAEMWGRGAQRLMSLYPDAPALGLSATNIRYLDNQRDMADELFDGNIASEMTLGEAIVRGILNPPKYVLSVFSYQKDLEKHRRRVRTAKSKAVRDAGEKYLEALRRALDKADGLDEIFRKHMTDRGGKYLVFCANFEHMRQMIENAPNWFAKVDTEPHIYSAYSDDPETSRAFADFKADDSNHLKLLFCIDMLNEGVHVEDVSGVILFRPTVSPIIYKQQIGRALSANKKKSAVIFDIVLNIENLYSIGAIEEEMRIAVSYYRSLGRDGAIVNDHFRVADELRDCVELFNRLNDTLGASWDLMYAAAKSYFDRNGNLEVPKRYTTAEGLSLGQWLNTQRQVYAGRSAGILTDEQIEKLNKIGMRWQGVRDLAWEKNFSAAGQYYRERGNLLVNVNDTYGGVPLGRWIEKLRYYKKNGLQTGYLTPERIAALEKIGMVWDVPDYLWEKNFYSAMRYYRKNGNLDVPCRYVDEDGIRLGAWLAGLRAMRRRPDSGKSRLTEERIQKLNEIGMIWDPKISAAWEKNYSAAMRYYREHGNLDIPAAYMTDDGRRLGRWLRRQRQDSGAALSREQRAKLDAIGMIWKREDPWEVKFKLAQSYYREHGDLNIKSDTVVNGVRLAKWLKEQAARMNGRPDESGKFKSLTGEQIAKLTSIGLRQTAGRRDIAWNEQYAQAKMFFQQNGHLDIPGDYIGTNGKNLSAWLLRQREKWKSGTLDEKRIALLDEIGMVWQRSDPWMEGYKHAEEYFKQNGDLCVPIGTVCEDGFALGKWIQNQRSAYNGSARTGLRGDQIRRLNEIGMIWSAAEYRWESAYRQAEGYYHENGGLEIPRGFVTPGGLDLYSWIADQKHAFHKGALSKDRIERLNALKIDWLLPAERRWEDAYAAAADYRRKNGDLLVPVTYKTPGGFGLGKWIHSQRKNRGKLRPDQAERLTLIGMAWDTSALRRERQAHRRKDAAAGYRGAP